MWKFNFYPNFHFGQNRTHTLRPMNSPHRASQFPAKSLRWHKLMPVGTDIADGSSRPNLVKSSGKDEEATAQLPSTARGHLKAAADAGHSVDPEQSLSEILAKAGKRALGGGLPGAAAMVVQVGGLMWLRTTMNYQYRHGTSTLEALRCVAAVALG